MDNELTTRTTQDILAERRANVLEAMRETDRIARGCLEAHVADLDRELARRRRPQWASPEQLAAVRNPAPMGR